MKREEAVIMARALRGRGIAPEWRITIGQTQVKGEYTGKYRVIISTPDGEQALAIYQARLLQQAVELPPAKAVS